MLRPTPRLAVLLACILGAVALTGCASSEDVGSAQPEPAPAPVTVTETQTVVSPPPTPPDPPATPPSDPAPAPAADPAPPSQDSGGIRVPNVVGKDHQLAQDTMQAAGLYNLTEEDATGQGRNLIWDRNWVVVSQSPAPGSRVSEDTTIVLRSKQDDE